MSTDSDDAPSRSKYYTKISSTCSRPLVTVSEFKNKIDKWQVASNPIKSNLNRNARYGPLTADH